MTQRVPVSLLALAIGFSGCAAVPAKSVRNERSRPESAAPVAHTATFSGTAAASGDRSLTVMDVPSQDETSKNKASLSSVALEQSETETPDGEKISTVSMMVTSNATDETLTIDSPNSAESDQPASGSIASSETGAEAYSLNLGNVLYLADAQNPNVAVARERINDAYARVERAKTLWVPSLRAGLNYNHHEGAIQDVAGTVFNTTRSSFYGGMGANAVGAGSPAVPGVVAQFHLTDAVFQPKIASHQASARRYGATAARNDTLRDAAVAYLELVRAEHAEAIAREALANTEKLTDLTQQYAETGQGLQSDHERLKTELALRQEELITRKESVQVASARLAQVLHADPTVLIQTNEPAIAPLQIINLEGGAASYVATGLSRRPELAEQKHLVCEAVERLRREKYAPLVPSVLLGMSYGGQGGGVGNSIINTDDRWDADAGAYWEIRNLGFGEQAARNETASLQRQAQMRKIAIMDNVAREVTEAHAQVTRRKERIELTERGVEFAIRSYTLNLERIENAQGLPIETLQSIHALATAQRAYLNAVVDYNIAQFELSRAIGWFVQS
ncbi:MAG: TolC family protein [Planctomyces sp.]|nr:TolC family protein [Planctomyces sp.]